MDFCKDSYACDLELILQGTILNGKKKKKSAPLGDISCEVCAHILNIPIFQQVMFCAVIRTLEKQSKKKSWGHMCLSKKTVPSRVM